MHQRRNTTNSDNPPSTQYRCPPHGDSNAPATLAYARLRAAHASLGFTFDANGPYETVAGAPFSMFRVATTLISLPVNFTRALGTQEWLNIAATQ